MDVGSDTIWKQEAFRILARPLTNLVCITPGSQGTRIMKLMSASGRSRRTQDGVATSDNLTISEVNEPFRHFDFRRDDSDHLRHRSSARNHRIGIKLLPIR